MDLIQESINNVDHDYVKTTIIVIAIVVVLYWCMTYRYTEKELVVKEEHEPMSVADYPGFCPECQFLGKFSCDQCENCGYCYTVGGAGECVRGDINGPAFKKDCVAYQYNGLLGTGRFYPDFMNHKYYYDRSGTHTFPRYRVPPKRHVSPGYRAPAPAPAPGKYSVPPKRNIPPKRNMPRKKNMPPPYDIPPRQ
jgi:hypothetical protein